MRPLLKRKGRSLGRRLIQQQQQHKAQMLFRQLPREFCEGDSSHGAGRSGVGRGGGHIGSNIPSDLVARHSYVSSYEASLFWEPVGVDDGQETLLSCYLLSRNALLPSFYCRLGMVYEGLMNLTWKPSNQVTAASIRAHGWFITPG